MSKDRSRLLHQGQWLFLFAFTATCTLFFFIDIVPAHLWWMPFVAWVGFEFGLLGWLDYHKHGARNSWQWFLSLMMVAASAVAITIATAFQITSWLNQAGIIHVDLWWMKYAVWSVVVIFPLNLATLVLCDLCSPEHLKKYHTIETSEKEAGVNGASHPLPVPIKR